MWQAITKICRFIIHVICNINRRIHCNLDDNSRRSTDISAESKEPLITTTNDYHFISIQTLDDNLSCSSDAVVESNEPFTTTSHDFHVITVQTPDDNSICSTDVVIEAKEPLITTTHDFHVISIPTLDDNLSCSSNVVVESKKPLPTTTHDSHFITVQTRDDTSSCSTDVVAEAKEPLITATHDFHVDLIQTEDDNISCSSDVVVESKEWLTTKTHDSYIFTIQTLDDNSNTTIHDSHAISVQIEDKDHGRPSGGNTHCSNSGVNYDKKNAKVKKIRAARIPKQPQVKRECKWLRHYCSNHRILLVGEGDFSFSACLAKAFGSGLNMVATSLDSLDFLEKNYPSAKSNIGCVRNRGGIVLHNMDATTMQWNIFVTQYVYDRIIYNFPLAGFIKEPKRQQIKRNRKLVLSFMENAKNLLASDGEIHITHKTSSMFQEWGLENLAKQCRLKLIEDVEFQLGHYPGYHNKYGFGGNRNFDCYPSRTYKFGLK